MVFVLVSKVLAGCPLTIGCFFEASMAMIRELRMEIGAVSGMDTNPAVAGLRMSLF